MNVTWWQGRFGVFFSCNNKILIFFFNYKGPSASLVADILNMSLIENGWTVAELSIRVKIKSLKSGIT